jgi:hypothetical protein
MTPMPSARRRRIVRRAVMVLVLAILLPVWYVGSWGLLHWCAGRSVVSWSAFDLLAGTVFRPLESYKYSDRPGSRTLIVMTHFCYTRGRGEDITWQQANAAVWSEDWPYAEARTDRSAW